MDIQQIINDRYKVLPANIQEAIKSADLASKFESIANKHGLHIDQNGSLQTETILVMLGLESSDDYVENIKKALEISQDEAVSIAQDVNGEILDSIRDSLRKMQMEEEQGDTQTPTPPTQATQAPITPPPPIPAQPTPAMMTPYTAVAHSPETLKQAVPENMPTQVPIHKTISSIESAGQFTIEKHPVSSSPQYKEENINRETMLKHIEDAPVPLVDHLLANPVSNPNEAEVKTTEPVKTDEKKAYAMDPYREAP